ncbi:general transcription factor II-I repeat domain-containing protein 2-like [Metopolophium dirhodum]|uniref:general transcription factor II-I repeat domain-containing protein 2-like n=1 Tax=Metopolophium dirhodum TaxID=44670 RepID=UPI00298F69E8|nr:general transcription factor II-I repeat domain-containing protein 2-like [Metopolophium dirhodum]
MIGAHQGFVQRLRNDPKCNSDLLSYHCIIHQSVLCCKLDPCLEKIMKTHRLFKALVQENDTQFDDLLLHNNVRWLSKGNVLQRFFNLLNEIELFLIQSTHLSAKDYHEFISDNSNIATIAFLTDIFQHINSFNMKLQGNQKLICHLVSEVNCFCRKIDFFLQDVGNERLHFHNLKKVVDENHEIDLTNFTKFLESLKTEFERRFADFRKIKNVVQLLNSSFTLQPDGEWINEAENVFNCNRAHLQMEIIEFQSDDVLKNLYNEKYSKTEIDSTYDEFWLKYVSEKKYPTLKLLTVKMCTMRNFNLLGDAYIAKKPRPLKIICQSKNDASQLIYKFNSQIRNGLSPTPGFRLVPDKTTLERDLLRQAHIDLEQKKDAGSTNLTISFVNGVPTVVKAVPKNTNPRGSNHRPNTTQPIH